MSRLWVVEPDNNTRVSIHLSTHDRTYMLTALDAAKIVLCACAHTHVTAFVGDGLSINHLNNSN
jgi:hypothetical protein